MKYKVHTAYIGENGDVIKAGIYDEHQIDLAIARRRTIVTAEDSNVEAKVGTVTSDFPVQQYTTNLDSDLKEVQITPIQEIITVDKIKINTADESDIVAIKFVGKATAAKVVTERSKTRFISYQDLDKRVPLAKNRKWEDVAVIDFEVIPVATTESTLNFI